MRVTKTVRFDAAHVLTDHAGACRNLHGHTYRVDVTVSGPDDAGMVVDFKALKARMNAEVVERFDHAFVYWTGGAGECEIAAVAERLGMRTVPLPFRTTSENLARHVFAALAASVPGLASVRVWETPDNCAEFAPEAPQRVRA